MTDGDTAHKGSAGAGERSLGQWLLDMPRWKKVALGVAISAVVVGGVWSLTQGSSPTAVGGAGASGGASALGAGLTDGGVRIGGGGSPGEPATEPASKGIFRLGFSFVAGFCIGSFLRATIKIASIAFGFWLVMTFALSYLGIVVVDWNAMDSLWNRFASNVESEWGNFQSFMTGSLPATGLAITGLAVGLKRH